MAYITKKPGRSLRGLGSVNPMDPLTQFVSQWYPRPPVVESPARVEYLVDPSSLIFPPFQNAEVLGKAIEASDWSVDLDDVAVSFEDAFIQPDGSCGNTQKILAGPVPLLKLSAISSFLKFSVANAFSLKLPTASTKALVGDGCDSTIMRLSSAFLPAMYAKDDACIILYTPKYPDPTVGTWMLVAHTPFQLAVWGDPTRFVDLDVLVLSRPKSTTVGRAMFMWRAMRDQKPLVQLINGVQYLTDEGRMLLPSPESEFSTEVKVVDVRPLATPYGLFDLRRADLNRTEDPVRVESLPASEDPAFRAQFVGAGGAQAFVLDYKNTTKPSMVKAIEQAVQAKSQPVTPPPGPGPGPGPIVPVKPAEVTNVGPWILGAAVLGSAWYWYSKKRGA